MGLFFISKKRKYKKFWLWFKKNEDRIFNFKSNQRAIFDELSRQLSLIDSNLTFEFSSVKENGKREFVISADGIKSSFAAVERLADMAPPLDKFTIIKFRPRRKSLNELKIGDKCVNPKDVYYTFFQDDNPRKVGAMLFFKEYSNTEEKIWDQIGYILLDEVIGEYDVETKIGAIVFDSVHSEHFHLAKLIDEMQNEFDEYFAALGY